MDNTIALLVSWNLIKKTADEYYIASTHYVYLQYICEKYKSVYLISSVKNYSEGDRCEYKLSDFQNIQIIELPSVRSFISAQMHFKAYFRAIKSVTDVCDLFYCRVPDPFSWMPKLVFRKKTIMHFVGDTIDATKHNENWSWLRKLIMIGGYMPDYSLTLLAAKQSKVYTNGHHLSDSFQRKGLKATAVISSTVKESSLVKPDTYVNQSGLRLVYIGYVRYAKGMNCLMQLWLLLKESFPHFIFDLVGSGEMLDEVRNFVVANGLEKNIIFHGHIDDRAKMNKILREGNLFVFPSLSEGSPRVVIEAMAQGIPVVSTPVGSLPTTFKDGETIRFFDFDNAKEALSIIKDYIDNPSKFIEQRNIAFNEVKNKYTIEKFLSTVFSYEA